MAVVVAVVGVLILAADFIKGHSLSKEAQDEVVASTNGGKSKNYVTGYLAGYEAGGRNRHVYGKMNNASKAGAIQWSYRMAGGKDGSEDLRDGFVDGYDDGGNGFPKRF